MELTPFLLEQWLEEIAPRTRFDLAASTGPRFTVRELLDLMTPEESERFAAESVVYTPSSGTPALRERIASLYGASAEEIVIATGGSEVLLGLFFLATEPGANVVLPDPGFPPFRALPEGMGTETRRYRLRHETDFAIDVDEILSLIDGETRLVIVNSPHNPTGAVIEPAALERLHEETAGRGIQLVVDEVYHPIYHGEALPSASRLPHASVLGDMSKAWCLSGLRVGWLLERDPGRRERLLNARSYFTISNSNFGETLAELAIRHGETILGRARSVAAGNLAILDDFFRAHRGVLEWTPPRGAFTAFPRLLPEDDVRDFCLQAAERGVLLAPGDCFGVPQHFRLGFGACDEGFSEGLEILSGLIEERWPAQAAASR